MTANIDVNDIRGFAHVEWEIEKYSELQVKTELRSPSFQLSDAQWCLFLHPNGETTEDKGWISLYLIKKKYPDTEKHHVAYTLGIKKCDGSVYESRKSDFIFFNTNIRKGWSKLLENSKLQELKDVLLPNDTLKVFCVARLMKNCGIVDTSSQTLAPEGFETLVENFTESYQKGSFGNVKFRVKDREFQAHRSILSARSPVFASMFEHDTTEKNTGVVDIIDCAPNSFDDFLTYLYTGKVDNMSSDNVFDLYKTAEKYDLEELKAKCARYMTCNLSVDSFCDVVLVAVVHNESDLLEGMTKFFVENVEAIISTPKWESFMKDHYNFANELFIEMLDKYEGVISSGPSAGSNAPE